MSAPKKRFLIVCCNRTLRSGYLFASDSIREVEVASDYDEKRALQYAMESEPGFAWSERDIMVVSVEAMAAFHVSSVVSKKTEDPLT